MNRTQLMVLASSTFMAFGVLLSVSIGLSAQDKVDDIGSQVQDLEYQIERANERIEELE